MSISSVFDVVLGMVVIYYALSLVVSYITTEIARLTQLRAKNLAKQLKELLQDGDNSGEPSDIFDEFMKHPWIISLVPKSLNWRGQEVRREVDRISPGTFAWTLLDMWYQTRSDKADLDLDKIKAGIEMLPNGEHKEALKKAINDSLKQVKDMRQLLESWYDNTMANVSALYKQKARSIAIIVGLVVTLVLGVDSVAIANGLWNNSAAQARLTDVVDQVEVIDGAEELNQDAEKLLTALTTFQEEVDFPIWWTSDELNRILLIISGQESTDQAQLTKGQFLWWKGLGLLITWVAVAQGSSFWYQVLQGIRRRNEVPRSQTQPTTGQPPGDIPAQPIEVVVKPSPQEKIEDETQEKAEEEEDDGAAPSPEPRPDEVSSATEVSSDEASSSETSPSEASPSEVTDKALSNQEKLEQLAVKVLGEMLASGTALADVDIQEAITELLNRVNEDEDLVVDPHQAIEAMANTLRQKGKAID